MKHQMHYLLQQEKVPQPFQNQLFPRYIADFHIFVKNYPIHHYADFRQVYLSCNIVPLVSFQFNFNNDFKCLFNISMTYNLKINTSNSIVQKTRFKTIRQKWAIFLFYLPPKTRIWVCNQTLICDLASTKIKIKLCESQFFSKLFYYDTVYGAALLLSDALSLQKNSKQLFTICVCNPRIRTHFKLNKRIRLATVV